MFQGIRDWYRKYRYRKVMASFRGHLLFFGYDVSQYTDQEIEDAILDVGEQMKEFGLTVQEAYGGLSKLQSVWRWRDYTYFDCINLSDGDELEETITIDKTGITVKGKKCPP